MWPFTTWKDRRIAELEARDQLRFANIAKLADEVHDLRVTLNGRGAVISMQTEEIRLYRQQITDLEQQIADLGRMLTTETVEAVEDVATAQACAGRYRAAWQSAQRRAVRLTRQLAPRDVRIRRLEQQLDDALGYGPAARDAIAAGEAWQDRRTDRPAVIK
jgi:predicted  nucleic acid-binding Zn-ribbon protein